MNFLCDCNRLEQNRCNSYITASFLEFLSEIIRPRHVDVHVQGAGRSHTADVHQQVIDRLPAPREPGNRIALGSICSHVRKAVNALEFRIIRILKRVFSYFEVIMN